MRLRAELKGSPMVKRVMYMRTSGRAAAELRKVSFERRVSKHAEGSCLVRFRRHPRSVYRDGRGPVAALVKGSEPRMGNRRIRHAASIHQGSHAPRGLDRQAVRPDPGDPEPHRPQPPCRGKPSGSWAKTRSPSIAMSFRPTAAPAPLRSPAAGLPCVMPSMPCEEAAG